MMLFQHESVGRLFVSKPLSQSLDKAFCIVIERRFSAKAAPCSPYHAQNIPHVPASPSHGLNVISLASCFVKSAFASLRRR